VNPLVVYLVLVAIAVGFALSAMLLTRPLRRSCPGCDGEVRMDALTCRSCGYRFA
jgi:multisubunit Na+/H+ antiporter MnhC subunit